MTKQAEAAKAKFMEVVEAIDWELLVSPKPEISSKPQSEFLRLHDIIGDTKANPPIPAMIPVSKTTWFCGVKSGRFPAPFRLGEGRSTFWRRSEIENFVNSI